MINNLKLGIKGLRYCYSQKANTVLFFVFSLLGLLLLFMEVLQGMRSAGGYFMTCAGMFPAQMASSLNVSNMVLASPVRKKMQTAVPIILSGCCMSGSYLVILLVYGIGICMKPDNINILCNNLIIISVMMVVVMIYLAVVSKYFAATTLVFIIVYCTMLNNDMVFGSVARMGIFGDGIDSFALAAGLGMAVIAAGCFIAYLASLLVYRAPMSRRAVIPALRRDV